MYTLTMCIHIHTFNCVITYTVKPLYSIVDSIAT